MENQQINESLINENYPDSSKEEQAGTVNSNEGNGKMPEKTWDGPLGEIAREANSQGYAQPEAEPRPEIEPKPHTEPEIQPAPERPDTGISNPLGNPDTEPQVQPPTIIQNPVAEYDSQSEEEHNKSSEEVEEESVEHSEKGNLNNMRGYNEPKSKESEFYK